MRNYLLGKGRSSSSKRVSPILAYHSKNTDQAAITAVIFTGKIPPK